MSGGELAQSGCYCIQAVIFCHLTNGAQISTSTHATSMGGSLTQQSPDFVKDPPKGFYPYPYEYEGPLHMRPLDRVDPLQRWLGSCPLLIFYGHHGPSFMAITSGFIGNLAAVTFGGCTAASLIQCKCMYMLIFWKSYINGALK